VGELLFRWRLAVIVGAFGLAGAWAALALKVDTGFASTTSLWGVERVWLVTGPLCLVAFALRVAGEARLGAAVYGQQASARVVSGGPFRFSRHPLYLGTWLFFAAACAPFVPPVVLAAIAAPFAWALASIGAHEERALAAKHGDAWTRYANAAPRFLGVPRAFIDDGITPSARDYASAVAGNVFFLSLGVYRIAAGSAGFDAPGMKLLGLVNFALLGVWLLVVTSRRLRARG
jgi:protein-S-isoprenylcysteine O-methyltransferase Ste14